MQKINKNKRGFTLVEMVLVVAIIVILAAVLALNISDILDPAKAKKESLSSNVESVQGKFQSYNNKLKGYGF